jgi:hypothetical protein
VTVEADLYATLKGLVGNRMYPDVAPSGAVTPFIVYQQIGGRSTQFLERGLPSKKNGRFQVAVWSATRSEAASIGLAIENAMLLATVFQVEAIGSPTADYDQETLLRGSRQDFGIWSDR